MKKIETERKYVIIKPNVNVLMSQNGFTSSDITQIYLFDKDKTHRIRKRIYSDGKEEYTENTKRRISSLSSIETEEEISRERFCELERQIAPNSSAVQKTRITFSYSGKVFEVDIYSEWDNTCILEVELENENEQIDFPDFISVVRDVTGDRKYSNHSMAYEFPCEIDVCK